MITNETPGLDPVTRQQLKDLENEKRMKDFEAGLNALAKNCVNLADFRLMEKAVTALENKVSKLLEPKPSSSVANPADNGQPKIWQTKRFPSIKNVLKSFVDKL